MQVAGIRSVTIPLNPGVSGDYTCSGNSVKVVNPDGTSSIDLTRVSN